MTVLIVGFVGLHRCLDSSTVFMFSEHRYCTVRREEQRMRTIGFPAWLPALGQGYDLVFLVRLGTNDSDKLFKDTWFRGWIDTAFNLGPSRVRDF